MTLEVGLKPFSIFLPFAQKGHNEPRPSGMKRKIHWVGKEELTAQRQKPGGLGNGERPPKRDESGYRSLASIMLGEVSDAQRYYANQLLPSPNPAWVAPNHFVMLHLVKPRRERRPSALFGRVKVCYPSDGYAQNVQELELLFPNKNGAPDVVHLNTNEILLTPETSLQSYCVRVKFLISPEDIAEFAGQENLFLGQGYLPEMQTGYIDLLDVHEHNQNSQPWLYVIGSRWYASIPFHLQAEVREKLVKLLQWNKLVFNYHPELSLPRDVYSLNRVLGLKPGFTDLFLIEPENPQQTLKIISTEFDKIFNQPIK